MKPASCAEAGIILCHLKLQSHKTRVVFLVPGHDYPRSTGIRTNVCSVSDSVCSMRLTLAVQGYT